MPSSPTLPLVSGIFLTSQSMVSQVSVDSSTPVGLSGPRNGRFMAYSPSDPYLPLMSWTTLMYPPGMITSSALS